MISAPIQSEWLKTRKRPLTLWVTGILLVVVVLYPPFMVGLSKICAVDTSQGLRIMIGTLSKEMSSIAQQMRDQVTLPDVIVTTLGVAASVSRLLMVILGAMLAGSEFAWGTARHLVGRTRDRLAFVGGKLAVILGLTLLLLVAALALGLLSGSGLTPVVRDRVTWDFLTPGLFLRLPLALLFAALTVVPYALLAFTIALVTRSTATGLSLGLLTLIIGEPIFAQILASLPAPWNELVYYTPTACIGILKGWMGTLIGGAAPNHVGRSVAVLLGYSLALAGLAFASFRQRELTA